MYIYNGCKAHIHRAYLYGAYVPRTYTVYTHGVHLPRIYTSYLQCIKTACIRVYREHIYGCIYGVQISRICFIHAVHIRRIYTAYISLKKLSYKNNPFEFVRPPLGIVCLVHPDFDTPENQILLKLFC